jgi:GNAT superfamily N-acetyltransferase
MRNITYRNLDAAEAPLIVGIDRSEQIEGVYRVQDGQLVYSEQPHRAAPWTDDEVAEHITRVQALLAAGGRVLSAWDGDQLVAFASLDTTGVGGDDTVLKLDMLYVTATHRSHGIGRVLTQRLAEAARRHGARTLYISATPTRGTVNAYLHLGADLLETPDPQLLALEPDDIHLGLRIV